MTVKLPLFIQEPLFWNVAVTNQISDDIGKDPSDPNLEGSFILFGTAGSNGSLIESIFYRHLTNTLTHSVDLYFFYQDSSSTTKRLLFSHRIVGSFPSTYDVVTKQKTPNYVELPPILTPINSTGLRLPSNSSLYMSVNDDVNISVTAIGGHY